MPKPIIGPCGGEGQPSCPPVPTALTDETFLVPEDAIIHAALQMSDEAKARLIEQLIATK